MRHAATLNKHEVTIFKNIKETQTPFFKGVYYILERIKDGSSKDLVKQIRNESDKLKRNELKKNLPAICFSGKFNKRSDSSILEHSGLICLDYDGYAKQKDLSKNGWVNTTVKRAQSSGKLYGELNTFEPQSKTTGTAATQAAPQQDMPF